MAEADNIMNKLSEVLNNPQTMTQINQIMSSLSGGSANEAQEQSDESSTAPDISSMLSSLMPPQQAASPPPSDSGIDIAKIMQITNAISQSGQNDQSIALLYALKPMLKDENQVKVDRIVKIFKLLAAYPLLRDSGLLGGDLFG